MKVSIILSMFVFVSCISLRQSLKFEEAFNWQEYHQIANKKGIENERWIEILYEHQVNLRNFDKFKNKGIDLSEIYKGNYKSRTLLSEIIIEGRILSEKENADSGVMFHTEYLVAVKRVLKKMHWNLSDTIKLKVMYGPVGDKYYAAPTSGSDRYNVGENVLLYLEPMEKTFKIRLEGKSEEESESIIKNINANRNNLNIYRPLKKYPLKGKDVYHKDKGKIGKKSVVFREIKSIVSLNKIRKEN